MSLKPCCEHSVYEHTTTFRDTAGKLTGVMGCDVCSCREFGYTQVKDPWWSKDAGISVGLLIAIFVVNVVFSLTVGFYQGVREAMDHMCVEVTMEGAAEAYEVCGEPKPIPKTGEFD